MIIFGYLQLSDFEKRGDTNGEKQVKAWNLNFENQGCLSTSNTPSQAKIVYRRQV